VLVATGRGAAGVGSLTAELGAGAGVAVRSGSPGRLGVVG